jgi:hypothetical protein
MTTHSPRPTPNPPTDTDTTAPVAGAGYLIRGTLTLAIVTIILHGFSLFDGTILDDYWHQKGLREHGWSFGELLKTLIIAPGDFIHAWWQTQDVRWDYLRPFFIVCMKTLYVIVGKGDPTALHAFSIALHFISALLIWRLAWLLTHNQTWSLVGALLFVVYPHTVVTVAWPSSQNVVIQTALLLGTLLCYIRASGLGVAPDARATKSPVHPASLGKGPLTWVMLLWLLALFTRENAILMPAILVSFDLAFGGVRHAWARRWFYLSCFIIGCGFMLWRQGLGIHPLPEVYCRRPAGDWGEYLPWLFAKFLHYICASIWLAPMTVGPTGRFNPWTEAPGDCILMLSIVGGLAGFYFLAARKARGWWIWPLWIALFIVPVAAVIATPHSGYMSAVGFALAAAVGTSAAIRTQSRRIARTAVGLSFFYASGMGFMAGVNRLQWFGTDAAEKYTPNWVMVDPPDQSTTDVFFINLPFVNVYCKPNLVARLGPWFDDANVHVLAYAPQPFSMSRDYLPESMVPKLRTIVEQIDAHSFTLAIDGQPYFSRLLGRFLLEAFRGRELFKTGQVVPGELFDTTILSADEQGVWKLRFTFERRLDDPANCFYLVSSDCGAARIRFNDLTDGHSPLRWTPPTLVDAVSMVEAGHAAAAEMLFAAAASDDAGQTENVREAFRPVALHMATVLGGPFQDQLAEHDLTADQWREFAAWWRANVDDRAIAKTWHRRHDFDELIYLRSESDWDRFVASFAVDTDLYLTGPPFPGPRGH